MHRWMSALALTVLPALSTAQLLDFDSACASPPCPIGTLYASSGVSITPATSPIVSGGTNGLAGTVGGGHYLSVPAVPTSRLPTLITLARPATSFSVQLASSNAASAPVTVTIRAFRAGVAVGSDVGALGNVNEWRSFAITNPGGFDSIEIDLDGGFNLASGADGMQFGGTCNGFADVQPGDSFCNAAEWLANRGITLGCAAGQYCPGQNVSRAQMALFMERLGNAVSPIFLTGFGALISAPSEEGDEKFICTTSPTLPLATRRVATASAVVGTSFALQALETKIAYSQDGGATWTKRFGPPTTNRILPGSANAFLPTWNENSDAMMLESGRSYRFALAVEAVESSVVPALLECRMSVRLDNAGASTATFDPLPQGR